MNPDLTPAAFHHLAVCRDYELLTCPEILAAAEGVDTLDPARQALKTMVEKGYFRTLNVPGFNNKIWYQPTAKGAQIGQPSIPKFLRSGLPATARQRAVLRTFAYFFTTHDSFLSIGEQAALCQKFFLPWAGHARPLVAVNGGHYHIYLPILLTDEPLSSIETAAARWLPLLDAGHGTLHFVTFNKQKIDDALAVLMPPLPLYKHHEIRNRLIEIDAVITNDQTGLARMQ